MDCEMVRIFVFFKLMWGSGIRDRKNIDFRGGLQRWSITKSVQIPVLMDIIRNTNAISEWGASRRRQGSTIGFVPTMGALHQGHLDLVNRAKSDGHSVVCSIFVNPLQFNDPNDLANYPVRIEEDRRLLEKVGCDALFLPERENLFKGFEPERFDLGSLDEFWEGPIRPGHFQGVVNVVQRLFSFVRPDKAYFGEKDRQQLTIIQWVAKQRRWPESIIPCPTVRENDGLALSSRNLRLNQLERDAAPVLFQALTTIANSAFDTPVAVCLAMGRSIMEKEPLTSLEYLGIAHPETLEPLRAWPSSVGAIALIAARLGSVRLIDNLFLSNPRA